MIGSNTMNNNVLISCIITTFNRSSILPDAVNSILHQTYDNWELIIVDDQSTDQTRDVIADFEKTDNRIKGYHNSEKGANRARNLGIQQASGKYIAFLDDDDISLPHRFERQLAALEKSSARFVVSWYEVKIRARPPYKRYRRIIEKGQYVGFPSRWLIEKELINEVGGFDPSMKAMQDAELSYRLSKRTCFVQHPEIVTQIFVTPDSTSSGFNAISGMLQLLDVAGHIMDPFEYCLWNFKIGINYYILGDQPAAKNHFIKAVNSSKRFYYRIGYAYFMLVKNLRVAILIRVSTRFLTFIGTLGYPTIMKHPIVRL